MTAGTERQHALAQTQPEKENKWAVKLRKQRGTGRNTQTKKTTSKNRKLEDTPMSYNTRESRNLYK